MRTFKNLFKTILSDDLLKSEFIAGLIYAYICVGLQSLLYSNLDNRIMSLSKATVAVGSFFVFLKWKDIKEQGNPQAVVIKVFPLIMKLEFVVYPLMVGYYLFTRNLVVFYWIDTFLCIFIVNNIAICYDYLKNKRYSKGNQMGDFLLDIRTITCITSTIGMLLSSIIPPSVEVTMFGLLICNTIDNFFTLKVFKEVYKEELQIQKRSLK